ncbi:MAG: hypothetical protein ABSB33_02615 [Tepidisphaeraceae bacterium]|jgi:hypothetical protein
MTQAPQRNSRTNGPVAAALAMWLGVQAGALGLCAMRVMFWARSPRAGEQLSLIVMLATQVAAASLLFPLLLGNRRSTVIALVTAWPFAELAAFLADAQTGQWIAGEGYVSVWLVTLHLWAGPGRNSWAKPFATAVAATLSLGGPLLWYLRSEFGQGVATGQLGVFGPIGGVISLIVPDSSVRSAWAALAILFASGLIARTVRANHANSRDRLST